MALEIARLRLQNQRIAWGKLTQPGAVVTWMGALQAQDYASVLWAVGLRCMQATLAGVEQAIAERYILRTWLLRGTLHLVSSADIRWMLDLLAPRLIQGGARRSRELELDEATYILSFEVLNRALEKVRLLSRKEMLSVLQQAGISTVGQRGYHILARTALEGLICFGPQRGKEQTFALLDDMAPDGKRFTHDESLAELARRYFTGHGPATLADFSWWSGLPAQEARTGLELVKPELQQETVASQTYWFQPAHTAQQDGLPAVYLLPGFDEYYLGYTDRSLLLDAKYERRAVSSNGIFRPMIIIDGRVAGTWKRTIQKGKLFVHPQPFERLNPAQEQALLAAAVAVGKFIGLPVEAT
jgi:hypothetical protein